MDDIFIKEVVTKKEKREFIYLPSKVHKNDPEWLPPIYMDEWILFDKKKNKSYQYADTVLYLAYKDKKPAGRIMGIVNNRYNTINNEKHGRFCFLECYEDPLVLHALIAKVETWAKEKGMTKLVGPLGFSDKDPQGLQIEGFEYPKFIVCPTNSPYLPPMLEKEGYSKNRDLVNYLIEVPKKLPLIYQKVLSRVEKKEDFQIIEFKSKKELKPYIIPALELMNETFSEIYGFVPLTNKEKQELASRYLPILDPKYIKVAENEHGLLAFAIAMPDISTGIKRANGKLFPFGIFKILAEANRSRKLLMLLGGIKKEYRGKGIDVLIGVKIFQSAIKHKIEQIDSHLVLESNTKMRGEFERVGGKIVKRFRIYQKNL
jgi:hypothetical protein